jgi:molybdopterin/thiamine biosynthesis adenylyltransferase
VFGLTSLDAHYYDQGSSSITPIRRVMIRGLTSDGQPLVKTYHVDITAEDGRPFPNAERYSRQIPLLGGEAQTALAASTIVIVGLGGLGSFVAMECAHLGIGHLILIDPDTVETSNLNRLIGATEAAQSEPKINVYDKIVRTISPQTRVTAIHGAILDAKALIQAKQADLLLGCVDNHGARLVMNFLAVQYAIPFIDAGTGVRLSKGGEITHAGGQVQLVLPNLGCLQCRDFIDIRQAAFDLAPPHVQQREIEHGYGTREPAPSVIFLNGVVASIQVAEAVKLITSAGKKNDSSAPIILYNLLRQSVIRAESTAVDTCPTCGSDGIAGLADLSELQAAGLPSSPPPALLDIAHSDA